MHQLLRLPPPMSPSVQFWSQFQKHHSLLNSRDQYQRVGVKCICLQLWQWYGLQWSIIKKMEKEVNLNGSDIFGEGWRGIELSLQVLGNKKENRIDKKNGRIWTIALFLQIG
ncbi:hypothetical protein DM860_011413 [Cuscuta australis]|uniref:Uncharacterized protein n=1 Tax=Cuscuta australis TaxID=267555 RepID=A0A328DTC8_9ASTE|nr:hypothetical protein DM860_011413 [Cuscuta australis]